MDIEEIIGVAVLAVIGLAVTALWKRISSIPKKEDIEALQTAISGIKKYVEQVKKEDVETETKQWTKIDDINARLGKVEGIVEMLSRRHNE